MTFLSPLQQERLKFQPKLPKALADISKISSVPQKPQAISGQLKEIFPLTHSQPFLSFSTINKAHSPLRVGVVLSGGQAPGGHNVISGLFDALKKLNRESRLFGFQNGPSGIIDNKHIEITEAALAPYRNQGGFDIIGSGRTKIETPEQFSAAEKTAKTLNLDGLVIIGGDDSNTNAALLAEYFLSKGCSTKVVGVPKTIDGDLKNEFIEISFGFDTATKTYSEIIGNILRDSLSAKKYYYFVKVMGRSASHIALECALKTHSNITLISEEVEEKKMSLMEIVHSICDIIIARAAKGKDFGVILIPEGIVEFIPEFRQLITELNALLTKELKFDPSQLTEPSGKCFKALPPEIRAQLLMDRDPHGNVQVSKIETERLFIDLVKAELKNRKSAGTYTGKFSAQPHFCGYEGRSCLPSNFDSQYCYALGHVAAMLIDAGATGYMSCVRALTRPVDEWQIAGIPLVTMMNIEERYGKPKPVIKKALVELDGKAFQKFKKMRDQWAIQDEYSNPGPIQFYGPAAISESIPEILIE